YFYLISLFIFIFFMSSCPLRSTLFPYTTLFRSHSWPAYFQDRFRLFAHHRRAGRRQLHAVRLPDNCGVSSRGERREPVFLRERKCSHRKHAGGLYLQFLRFVCPG